MSNHNPGRGSRSAPPSSGAPVASSVAVVVTLVALVLGFLILRQINTETQAISGPESTQASVPSSDSVSVPVENSTTTTQPMTYLGTNVLVANCSSLDGVARALSLALGGLGFQTADPTNGTVKLATSKVYYNPDDIAALPVANTVSRTLGNIPVEPAPVPLPAGNGAWPEGTSVVVMLGDDYAGRTIAEIQARPSTGVVAIETTTTPAA